MPAPGIFVDDEVPLELNVVLNGPIPTEVEIPLGDRVILTPGRGLNDFRKRHSIVISL